MSVRLSRRALLCLLPLLISTPLAIGQDVPPPKAAPLEENPPAQVLTVFLENAEANSAAKMLVEILTPTDLRVVVDTKLNALYLQGGEVALSRANAAQNDRPRAGPSPTPGRGRHTEEHCGRP